ncbi:hypothetical protein QTP88_023378 [Uroleucon formosanum]
MTSSVSTMQWTKQECAFAVEAVRPSQLKSAFRNHFNIGPASCVLDWKFVCGWTCSGIPVVCKRNIMDFAEPTGRQKTSKGEYLEIGISRHLKVRGEPFSKTVNTETINSAKLEEELIEVTTNEELKLKFKEGYQVFWLQKQIPILYPGLWAVVQTFLIAFPSSYLVERGFSAVTNLLTKKRQRLQITNHEDLRMLHTKIESNINELLAKHQPHPSH